jgi:hypothetical protein
VVAVLRELWEDSALRASTAVIQAWIAVRIGFKGHEPTELRNGGLVCLVQELEVVDLAVFGFVGDVGDAWDRWRFLVRDHLEGIKLTVLGLVGYVDGGSSLRKECERSEGDKGSFDGEHFGWRKAERERRRRATGRGRIIRGCKVLHIYTPIKPSWVPLSSLRCNGNVVQWIQDQVDARFVHASQFRTGCSLSEDFSTRSLVHSGMRRRNGVAPRYMFADVEHRLLKLD